MSAIIEVQDLVKRYKKADKNAVDGVSFSVEAGEFFSLLGPNGAGKTTTISILTTTLAKTSGQVLVDGSNLDREPSAVRRKIGIIFQNPSLDLNLTAEENVRFHAVLYGLFPFRPTYKLMPKGYRDRVSELAHILEIKDEMFKPIKTFSGGMRRKLEIIRSLIHSPKVLFLDEPTIGLDPLSRRTLWEYLRRVREEQGTTIFLTSHYLEEAEQADRICIIKHGKVISTGTPEAITSELIDSYIYLETDQPVHLSQELSYHHLQFTHDEGFKVKVHDSDLQQFFRTISTPLTHVSVHSPTLEEAYLKIVENGDTPSGV